MARVLDLLFVAALLIFAAVFGWVGYEVCPFHILPRDSVVSFGDELTLNLSQMYIYVQTLTSRGKARLAKNNITFNKNGGLRVGLKETTDGEYRDQTQNLLVKAWNLSEWPAYKRPWWNRRASTKRAPGRSPSRRSTEAPEHDFASLANTIVACRVDLHYVQPLPTKTPIRF